MPYEAPAKTDPQISADNRSSDKAVLEAPSNERKRIQNMAEDRALFAAFQKVRGDLEGALARTRKIEEETRAREEAERIKMRREGFSKQAAAKGATARVREAQKKLQQKSQQKSSPVSEANQTHRGPNAASSAAPSTAPEPKRLSKSAATGAFGSLLADAANSAGAVFRSAQNLKSEAEQKGKAAKKAKARDVQTSSSGEKHAPREAATLKREAPATRQKRKEQSGQPNRGRPSRPAAPEALRQLEGMNKLGQRGPQGEQKSRERNDRKRQAPQNAGRPQSALPSEGQSAQAVRSETKLSKAQQAKTDRSPRKDRAPRLTWAERRNPIPPFELAPGLPVSERADEIIKAIRENQVVIVCGETGSGKTTQLPKIALMAGRGEKGRIGCTQPRRIAASSIAARIAEELKTAPGDVVGYKVRFTDHTAPGATIKLMTDGILLAETQGDPMLSAYDTIIIDEAHERSINIDFLLGYLKRLIVKRPDLKVIVTSATIDSDRFAEHFAVNGRPAPVLNISGRTYPVEIRWRPIEDADEEDDRTMLAAIENALSELEAAGPGDILVFFPGEREIREAADYLRKTRVGKTEILPLFARLSASDQARVFAPSGMRRIVLATNVAETSLTVPGIRYVVDPGYARVKRYSYRYKVEQLLVERVSQASANQRAGRCGRVADGICIRLYSEEDFAGRPAFTDPEIMRSNLAAVILRAMSLKLGDVREFPFVQAPPPKAFADGFSILEELAAVNERGELTRLGETLAKLPVDPKLGRMLMAGNEFGALRELLIITSGLSVQDPRERPLDAQQAADEAHRKLADERSDFLSYVKLWDFVEKARAEKESNRKFDQEMKRRYLSPRRLREWREVEHQLESLASDLGWRLNTAPATFEEVHRALLSGLLGNIGSKAVESDFRAPPYLGARGIKFWIWPGSIRAKKCGRWILAGQIMETSKLYARCVADIDPEWIERAAGSLIRKNWSEPHWEKKRGEVVALEKGTLYGLTVYQGRRVSFARHDPKLARELFIREGLVEGEIEGDFAFLKHNLRLVKEIRDMEHKTRRPDVLVDEQLIFDFYDRVIPEDVNSTATLAKWLKAEKTSEKSTEKSSQAPEGTSALPVEKRLRLSREELMRHEAAGATTQYFPKKLEMAGVEMALTYNFEPGSPRDGVTMAVPLFALNQIDPVRAEWLVPGMVKEKAQVLLKSLPQKIRRHCVPIADYAKGFFTRMQDGAPQSVGFLQALADDIRGNLGIPCTPSDFKPEQLPAHLILNFKVVDEHGRQLAMGRNLSELRAELGREAQETFRSVAQADASVARDLADADAVTDWTFGELPELMEIQRRGETLIGHPALVDRGDVCSIEVFDDPVEAQKAHRKGLLKLFRLTLREQVKFVERTLRELGRVQMQASIVPGLSKSFESFESLEHDVVDCALTATALADPLPNDEASFRARREDVRGRLTLVAGEVARLITEIASTATLIPMKLKRFAGEKRLLEDVNGELLRLFPPHFLLEVPLSQLAHYPRYMKAIVYRLDRYADDPARDEAKSREIERLSSAWQREVAKRRGQPDPHLVEFGWLLEELRVSLFAQQLRTPMPVSVKRLERVWQSIARL